MAYRNLAAYVSIVALSCGIAACRQQQALVDPNKAPFADARAVDPATGMATEGMIDVAYDGEPVKITLDGTMSRDAEGKVEIYRWLSATTDPDAGGTRAVAAGQAADWPADTGRVEVSLGPGEWIFNLWVADDEGEYSEPDTIKVKISAADPVAACVAAVVDVVAEPCRMCMCGIESCRPTVIESACDGPCWELIQCIGANCPDFAAMAATMDYSCLTANCGAQYTASMAGATPMGATPAGACATMCPTECSSTMM